MSRLALLKVGLSPAAKVLDLKGGGAAAGVGGRGAQSFRSSGGQRAHE
jgi:hypothetical protein